MPPKRAVRSVTTTTAASTSAAATTAVTTATAAASATTYFVKKYNEPKEGNYGCKKAKYHYISRKYFADQVHHIHNNPMRRQWQFTVKRPPKCAVMSTATTTTTAATTAVVAVTTTAARKLLDEHDYDTDYDDNNLPDTGLNDGAHGIPNQVRERFHNNPMRRRCQFTVKRSERSVDLTVADEQQPCGVQVVEWVGLVASGFQFFGRIC
ncbi:hypothetical protein OAM02_00865 [Verrucomicrobia bacterium]|nr:hypothetical protein [Verrucomicrobiota bacterium]